MCEYEYECENEIVSGCGCVSVRVCECDSMRVFRSACGFWGILRFLDCEWRKCGCG